MSAIAPGWYADPQTAGQLRYWDGTAWTEHVQPGGGAAAVSSPAHQEPPAGASDEVERRLATLEEAVAVLERRLERAADALSREEEPPGR